MTDPAADVSAPAATGGRRLAYAVASNYTVLALQIIGLVVLSRLLRPEEIGTFAVAAVFTALAGMMRDFGLSSYVVQADRLDEARLRAALSLSLLSSWTVGAVVFAAAPAVALLYATPQLADILRLQSLNFLLIPFGAVTMAWFRREMRPAPGFVAATLSEACHLAVAIGCAMRGLGAMSLAWASLAGVAVTVLVSLVLRPRQLPALPGVRGLRELAAFTGWTGGSNLLQQLGRSAPELLIGRVVDIAAVALFSRANALVVLFQRLVLSSMQSLVLPGFARDHRAGLDLRTSFIDGMARLTAVGWPMLLFLALTAPATIRLAYGDQWAAAADLARVLCAAAAIDLPCRFAADAVLATGDARTAARMRLQVQALQVVGLLAVFPWGLAGACWGLLAAALLGAWVQQRQLRRSIGLEAGRSLAACGSSAVVALLACVPTIAWLAATDAARRDRWPVLLVGAAMTVPAWWLALRLRRHPLADDLARAWPRRH